MPIPPHTRPARPVSPWAIVTVIVLAAVVAVGCLGAVVDALTPTGTADPRPALGATGTPPPTRTATPTRPKPSPTSSRKPKPKPKPSTPRTDPRYRTCAEANQHGYGPYRRGVDPEYRWYIDRDSDGTVCKQ